MEEIDRGIRNASSFEADRDGHTDFVEGSDVQEGKGQSHIATDRRDEREHCAGRQKGIKDVYDLIETENTYLIGEAHEQDRNH